MGPWPLFLCKVMNIFNNILQQMCQRTLCQNFSPWNSPSQHKLEACKSQFLLHVEQQTQGLRFSPIVTWTVQHRIKKKKKRNFNLILSLTSWSLWTTSRLNSLICIIQNSQQPTKYSHRYYFKLEKTNHNHNRKH